MSDGELRITYVDPEWERRVLAICEPKTEPVPPEIAERQRRVYERLVASRRARR